MNSLAEYVKQQTNGQLRVSEVARLVDVPLRTVYWQWDNKPRDIIDTYIKDARDAKRLLL